MNWEALVTANIRLVQFHYCFSFLKRYLYIINMIKHFNILVGESRDFLLIPPFLSVQYMICVTCFPLWVVWLKGKWNDKILQCCLSWPERSSNSMTPSSLESNLFCSSKKGALNKPSLYVVKVQGQVACWGMFIYRLSGYIWRRGRLTHRDNFLGMHIVTVINFKLLVGTSLEVGLKREKHTLWLSWCWLQHLTDQNAPIDANVHPSVHTQFIPCRRQRLWWTRKTLSQ